MSGAPQLERSVLEGKERDELHAIADALGQTPAPRAKKADLVELILQATGVTAPPAAAPEPAKPRRVTRKRVAATLPTADDDGDRGASTQRPGDPAGAATAAAPDEGAAASPGPAATDEAAPPEPDPAREPAPVVAPADGPTAEAAAAAGTDGTDGGERSSPSPAATTTAPPAPEQRAPRPAQQPPGPPGPGNHAVPAGQGQPGQGQPGQGQPGQPGQGQPGGAEGEVRRNRRRRGRDRERVGSGYDQQAQQADQAYSGEPLPCDGLLELRPEGFGFLRTSGYLAGPDDVYVSTSQVRRFALRAGDRIAGASRPPTTQERFGALLRIDSVADLGPDEARRRPRFEDLTLRFPDERLTLETPRATGGADATGRIIDLLAPIGKGQRALIVSPPKAGRTTVIKHIAEAIEANHPEVDLMVLLLDERPEEVTDVRRRVRGEVIASTFDRPPEDHVQVAELALEVAKRRVELGRDVVIILDGITRLVRAYNLATPPTGRILPGGLDAGALHPPKRFLGAARNIEGAGSLTIVATALVETGSTTDTVIFEEFKGTGNAEVRLDRRLAERRRYPAIDVTGTSTRHEELLVSPEELRLVWQLRRVLVALGQEGSAHQGHELLIDRLQQVPTNAELLADLARDPAELAGTGRGPLALKGSL